MPRPTFERLSVLLALGVSAASGACYDWDKYDPRLGADAGTGASGGSGGGGSSGGVMCSLPLADRFDMQDLGLSWVKQEAGGTVGIVAQQLVLTLPTTMANSSAFIVSAKPYDLTGCRAFVKLLQIPSTKTKALAIFELAAGTKDAAVILETEGKLQSKRGVNGNQTILDARDFDPVNHVYLGISELDGVVRWETSRDGKSWVTTARAASWLPSLNVLVKIGAVTYQTEPSAPGEIHFDDVDVPP